MLAGDGSPDHAGNTYRLSANLGADLRLGRSLERQGLVGKTMRHPENADAYKVKLVAECKFGLDG